MTAKRQRLKRPKHTVTFRFDEDYFDFEGARAMHAAALTKAMRDADGADEKRRIGEIKKRLKLRMAPSEWPLDAVTLDRSDSVSALDVRAPVMPAPPTLKTYQYRAGTAATPDEKFRHDVGIVAVDEHLESIRHKEFLRDVAATAALRGPAWTPELVDARLIEAFKVLFRLRGQRVGPRQFGSAMPQVIAEMSDLVSQEENRTLRQAMSRLLSRSATVSAGEHRRMEEALGWATDYLKLLPDRALCVNMGAMWRASGARVAVKCGLLGMDRPSFDGIRSAGLALIAGGLVATGAVPA